MRDREIELPRPLDFHYHKNLADYTKPELDRFRELCNFTEDETDYFDLRSKGKSNIAIYMEMCISESKLHSIRRNVERKIKMVS